MEHKRQEECGWVRGMYKPDQEGEYLIEDLFGKSVAKYDGEFWEDRVDHLICWTFIPETKIYTPF